MIYNESNPERRNLVVLSMCIIIYYLAGGSVPTDTNFKLLTVNVSFERSWVIASFLWVSLAWFTFRYWLIHQPDWQEKFYSEAETVSFRFYRRGGLYRKAKAAAIEAAGQVVTDFDTKRIEVDAVEEDLVCKVKYRIRGSEEARETDFLIGPWWKLKLIIHLSIRKPTVTTMLTPYLLALVAFSFGVIELVNRISSIRN